MQEHKRRYFYREHTAIDVLVDTCNDIAFARMKGAAIGLTSFGARARPPPQEIRRKMLKILRQ